MSNKFPPPELAVLDGAIQFYLRGGCHYTCYALTHAVRRRAPRTCVHSTYTCQYTLWCRARNGGSLPYWWNRSEPFRRERLAALRGFRQACIDAATKEK